MIICSFFNDIFSIYDFSIGYWNGFDSVVFLGFHLIQVYLEGHLNDYQ